MAPASRRFILALLLSLLAAGPALADPEPLAAWNPGVVKDSIIEFVAGVTDPESQHYVDAADRVAVFDNDGTLWAEKPLFFQFEFVLHRIRQMAPEHPEWRQTEPFKSVLEGDRDALIAQGIRAFRGLVGVTQTGMSQDQYHGLASAFLQTARHPELEVRYTDLVYVPMLELVRYLQESGFKVFIVSGGDIGFIRSFSEPLYGIPRENVIGSSVKYRLEETSQGLSVLRVSGTISPNVARFKAQNIHLHIGRRPIFVAANSDGDMAMMRYTSDRAGRSLVLLLRHDDAEREFAYDRGAEESLELAPQLGWYTVSMKQDFRTMFPVRSGAEAEGHVTN